jgi:hypothetical protein
MTGHVNIETEEAVMCCVLPIFHDQKKGRGYFQSLSQKGVGVFYRENSSFSKHFGIRDVVRVMIKIEDYRGWEISFDTSSEEFYALSGRNDTDFRKKSFSAIKREIDEFMKENQAFKPFKVEAVPSSFAAGEVLTIVGIRKDGRFIAEKGGKKVQISDYNEKGYMAVDDYNKPLWQELNDISKEVDELYKRKEGVKSQFKVKTLGEIKKELGL